MDHVHLNCFTRMKLIMIMYKGIISNKWIHEKMKKNWCKKQKKDILNIKELCKKNILTFLFTKKKCWKNLPGLNGPKHVQAPHLLTFHLVLIVDDLTHLIDYLIDGLWQHSYLASIRKLIDWNLIHILMNVFWFINELTPSNWIE